MLTSSFVVGAVCLFAIHVKGILCRLFQRRNVDVQPNESSVRGCWHWLYIGGVTHTVVCHACNIVFSFLLLYYPQLKSRNLFPMNREKKGDAVRHLFDLFDQKGETIVDLFRQKGGTIRCLFH